MRVCKVFSFDCQSLLERFVNVGLDVVLVELAFAFLVLSQVVAHFLVQPLLLLVQVRLHNLVVAFAFVVLHFDL